MFAVVTPRKKPKEPKEEEEDFLYQCLNIDETMIDRLFRISPWPLEESWTIMLSVQVCMESTQEEPGLQAACQRRVTVLSVLSCPHTQRAAENIKFEQQRGKLKHLVCLHTLKSFAMSLGSFNILLSLSVHNMFVDQWISFCNLVHFYLLQNYCVPFWQ